MLNNISPQDKAGLELFALIFIAIVGYVVYSVRRMGQFIKDHNIRHDDFD